MSKAIDAKVAELIAPAVDAAGYDLVRVRTKGGGKYAVMQIMIERKDEVGITVDDCASVSKIVTALFEQDADLADTFDLEVSSPGVDRPLVRLRDYERYVGHVAKVELKEPLEGRRRFQGKIVGVSGDTVELELDDAKAVLAFEAITEAKLVLTDALLKAAASGKASH